MVDARDIAEVAALELIRRDSADGQLPSVTINLVGPDVVTGQIAAAAWSGVLGHEIVYPGEDLAAFEAANRATGMPSWMARDMRLMAGRFARAGMLPDDGDADRLTGMLGRPLRTYGDMVAELTAN